MPKVTHQHITSRRTLLSTAALVAPASLLPALAAAAGGDRLVELEREFFRYYRWEDLPKGMTDDDPRIALYTERWEETAERIIAAPATTAAGLRAKVRVLMLEVTDGQSAYGEDLARSLLADLDRLAGSVVA